MILRWIWSQLNWVYLTPYWKGKSWTLVEKGCLIFLFRSNGGSCPYKKNKQNNVIPIYILIANFFHAESALFLIRHFKFLLNLDRALLEILPSWIRIFSHQNLGISCKNQKPFFVPISSQSWPHFFRNSANLNVHLCFGDAEFFFTIITVLL